MAQARNIIPDVNAAQIISAVNASNRALATFNSGPTAPTEVFNGKYWVDTSQTKHVLKVYQNGSWTEAEWANASGSGGTGGLDFDQLSQAIIPGQGTDVFVDEDNEQIAINAQPQNGRLISLGNLNFTANEVTASVKFFNTNIPASATDTDENIMKLFLTNSESTDSQNAQSVEFIVGLLGNADNNQAIRRLRTSLGNRDVRIWKSTYTPAGSTDSFLRVNIRRLSQLSENVYYWGFLVFAPPNPISPGGNVVKGNTLVGPPGPPGQGLASVTSDSTLTGDGTAGSPLEVTTPYSAAEKAKLAALSEDALETVATDATLSGDGTAGSPLEVATPFTPSEKTKLASIDADAISTVSSDATLSGTGAEDDPLGVANPFTASDKERLDNASGGQESLHALSVLQGKTDDLQAGTPSTGWSDITNVSQGGLAVRSGAAFDLASARVATYSSSPSGPAGKYLGVRLPKGTNKGQARVILTSGDSLNYTLSVTSFHPLGSSGLWDYYGEDIQLGTYVATLTLQLTGNAAHVGSSTFSGNLTQEKTYEQTKEILKAGTNVTITTDDDEAEITISAAGGTGGDGGGLSTVISDSTLTGDGSADDPLEVAIPFTSAEKAKLAALSTDQGGGLSSVSSDATLTGSGTTGSPLKVAVPYSSAEKTKLAGLSNDVTSNATLTGDGTSTSPLGVTTPFTSSEKTKLASLKADVTSNATLTGDGTVGSPLGVTTPFTTSEKTKLSGLTNEVSSDATLTGDGTVGKPLKVTTPFSAAEKSKLAGLKTDSISSVNTDATISGDGTAGKPLKVTTPYSATEKAKLASLSATVATGNTITGDGTSAKPLNVAQPYSAAEKAKLAALSEDAIEDVASDSTLTGDGTSGNPLSVAIPFSQSEKTKLAGLSAGGGGVRTDVLDHRVEALETKTTDLQAGPTSTGWSNAASDSQGGIVSSNTEVSFDVLQLRAWVRSRSTGIGSHLYVRIPINANAAQYRVQFRSSTGTLFEETLTNFALFQSDSNWKYYYERHSVGTAVAALTLQVTGSAAHIGTSTFVGNLTQEKVYPQVQKIVKGGANVTVTQDDREDELTIAASVTTDSTITGVGTTLSPLRVANPFTSAEKTKLAGLSNEVADNSISSAKLQSEAVTTAKLDDEAVTTAKLDDNAVTEDKLANDAVTTNKLEDEAVTTAKLDDEAVTTAKLDDDAVTEVKIDDGAVTKDKIANKTIVDGKLADDVTERLLPVPTDSSSDGGKVAALKSDGSGYELVAAPTGGGNNNNNNVVLSAAQIYGTKVKHASGSSTTLTTSWQSLTLADTPVVNKGTFTKGTTDVEIGVAGEYLVSGQVAASTTANGRGSLEAKAVLVKKSDTSNPVNSIIGKGYLRTNYPNFYNSEANFVTVWRLEVGDKISLQTRLFKTPTGTNTFTLDLTNTNLNIALLGGVKGDRGAPGSGTGSGGGLSTVVSDSTLEGTGASASPLKVANPFTAADETKLDGIAANAIASVVSDSSMTGAGTSSSPLALANPFTSAEKTKLAGLSNTIADGAVTTAKLANEAVTTAKLDDEAVTEDKLGDGSVTADKVADRSISTNKLGSQAVSTAKLNDGAVTTAKLDDSAVTTVKVNNKAITVDKLGDGAVGATQLGTGAVTEIKLATDAVTASKLKSDAVTSAKIANVAVTSAKLATGAVTETKIGTDAVTTAKIDDEAVTASKLGDEAVTTAKLADDSVTEDKILDDAVTSAKLEDGAVTSDKLAAAVGGRLLPTPTDSNSDGGKVAALNSAGTAYVLVAQSGGSGGDSTAVAPPTQVFSTGFRSVGRRTTLSGTDWLNLTLATTSLIKQGTFTVSGNTVTIGVSGTYLLSGIVSAQVRNESDTDLEVAGRFVRTKASDSSKVNSVQQEDYSYINNNRVNVGATIWELAAGDKISLQIRKVVADSSKPVDVRVNDCRLNIVIMGGVKGEKGDAGLTTVASDGTLEGDGSVLRPLKVSVPYSTLEKTKLASVATNAIATVATDATLTGTGAAGSPISIAADSITTAKLDDDAVTTAKLGTDAVTTAKIDDSAVTADKLGTDAVTTIKLDDGAVTSVKLGNEAVTTAKLDDDAVTDDKLADDAVVTAKVKDEAVTLDKLASDVTEVLLPAPTDSSGDGGKVAALNSAGTAYELVEQSGSGGDGGGLSTVESDATLTGDGSSSSPLKVTNPFTASDESKLDGIAANAIAIVTSDAGFTGSGTPTSPLKLASNAVAGTNIVDEAVTSAKIDDGAVTSAKLSDDAVSAAKIDEGAVTNTKLGDKSVTSSKLDENSVLTKKLNNGAVTTAKLADDAVDEDKLDNDVVERLLPAPTDKASDSGKIAALNSDGTAYELVEQSGSGGDGTGLTSVSSDSTLTGSGTAGSLLRVANPFTDADEAKLDGIAANAIASVSSDATLSGTGKSTDVLKVANPFTSANKTKLDGIAANAIATVASDTTLTGRGTTGSPLGIATNAIGTTNIANGAVTAAKIGSGAVTSAKIGDDEVTTDKINDEAVTTDKLDDKSVTTDKLEDDAVTDAKLATNSVGSSQLKTGAVTNVKLASASVTDAKLALQAVGGLNIKVGAVSSSRLASKAVTAEKLADAVGERLLPAPTDSASDAKKIAALNSAGDAYELVNQSGGLTAVTSDATLTGTGAAGSPLKVAVPFTTAEKTKLRNLSSTGGGTLADVEYQTVGSSTSISSTYANVLTTAETTGLPDAFFLEIKGTVGARTLLDVFPVRKASLSSETSYQFAHASNVTLNVRVSGGRLQVRTTTNISSATALVYKARAARGPEGPEGPPGQGITSVSTGSTITGDGSAGSPLNVANPFTNADEAKLDGIAANAIASVSTDSSLTGSGTSTDTLRVANPFTDSDEAKLDGIAANAIATVTSDSTLTGSGTGGSPLRVANNSINTARLANEAVTTAKLDDEAVTEDKLDDGAVTKDKIGAKSVVDSKLADDVTERLLPSPSDSSSDGGKVAALNSAGTAYELVNQSGGITSVTSDATLTGSGSAGSPLKVANPFTAADETKLNSVAANAIASVRSDGTLTGLGTSTSLLRVAVPFTAAEKSKLATISGTTGVTLSNVEYETVGSSTAISTTYANLLTAQQTTDLPDVFYLEVKGTVGSRDLYEVYPIRKAEISSEKTFQFAHTSAVSLKVRITGGRLQVQTVGAINSGSAIVYIAKAPRGEKGEKGNSGDSGIDSVATDATLTGDGTAGDPLKVVTPFTASEKNKLDNLVSGGEALHGLEVLQDKTSDLAAGTAPSGWVNATSTAQGGLAVRSAARFGLTQARTATYSLNPSSPGGKYLALQLPRTTNVAQARIVLTGLNNNTYTIQANSMHFLGEAGSWKWYGENLDLGDNVTRVTLQLTGNAAHVGTSTFSGNLVKDKVYPPVKQIIKAGSNISVSANDSDGTLTIASTASGSTSVGAGSVGTTQLANNAVTTAKIANGAVTNAKLGSNSVGGPQIVNSAISGPKIRNGAVTLGKMAANSVGTSQLVDDSVTLDKMANNSVGASQLANNAVTASKIANGSVTNAKLTVNSIGGPQLVNGAVSDAKLRSNSVTTAKIANDAVTVDKIANNVVSRLLPSSLGTKGQVLQVNSAANGVEYADASGGGGVGITSTTVTINVGSSQSTIISNSSITDSALYFITVQSTAQNTRPFYYMFLTGAHIKSQHVEQSITIGGDSINLGYTSSAGFFARRFFGSLSFRFNIYKLG